MKAIVLTYDRNHPMTDHMIRQYDRVWPDHPFVFRVPFQRYPAQLKDYHSNKIELIETPADIKQSLLTLISDLPDDEWVYWCIDDKYPVSIKAEVAMGLHQFVSKVSDENIQGAMFCRCRKLLEEENLRNNTEITMYGDIQLVERKNFYQFWIHQYMRVGVLRSLFNEFPDQEFRAKEMDTFTGQEPGLIVKDYDQSQKMYVTSDNFAQFGESTLYGVLTKNCYESMIKIGIEPPESIAIAKRAVVMGGEQ